MLVRRTLARVTGVDETGKQRMRLEWLRLELGVELHRDVPRMRRQFDDFDERAVERTPDDLQPLVGQRFFVQTVEFIPVAVPLMNDRLPVQLMCP